MMHTPTWTKRTKQIGIILFLIGLVNFTISLSLNNYHLSSSIVNDSISQIDKQAAFKKNAAVFLDQTIDSKFEFIRHLEETFDKANRDIEAEYRITDADLTELIAVNIDSNGAIRYLSENIKSIAFQSKKEFKQSQISSYTGWMNNKNYDSKTALEEHLRSAINGINGNIRYQKGFAEGKIASLLFTLTKKASVGFLSEHQGLMFFLTIFLMILGGLSFIIPIKYEAPAGIKNNRIFLSSATSAGFIGYLSAVYLVAFYILLYMNAHYITNWVLLVDPISVFLNGSEASQWFLYGFLYTLAILVMGIRMMIKYRHNRYQVLRSASVMFFQTAIAFCLVQVLQALQLPTIDFKNIWPLDYSFFFDYRLNELIQHGTIGYWMLGWGIALFVIGVPLFTFFFGKRWYCSWVCGCGGLAETAGDPYRQLSNKSLKAWKFERISIHSVLIFAILMTAAVLYTYFTNNYEIFGLATYKLRQAYSFLIGAIFSGVIGTGFYPVMGNRVWCRFGCPLAAYLGLIQRFRSRFRITTNGSQCISCGNCSTYCEMGIDVRWYAQRGQDILRSSCVGCGICSAVCPRGVLKLENGTVQLDQEYAEKELIS